MKICEWTPDYSVGVTDLDNHHQSLFNIINDLFNLIDKNADDKSIINVLSDFLEYTRYHFTEEEQMMEKIQYPDLPAHRKLHQDLTQVIEASYHEAHNGKAIFVALRVANMGLAWLKNHIYTVDTKYSAYILEYAQQ